MENIDPRSTHDDRTWRRIRVALTAGALAMMTALAMTLGIAPGPPPSHVAGQVHPTSTPIRLTRLTPAAAPSPTPAPTEAAAERSPTFDAVVVVVEVAEDTADPTEAAPPAIAITFEADDWAGGHYQGNGAWYGRAWTAVYGAQSEFPAATLTFELDAAPDTALVLTVAGLDDELAGKNPIALEVNGERVYQGDSPFASWDGNTANQAQDARWTSIEVTLPAALFTEGQNTIAFLNLSPSASFGVPPYNLLSTASLASDDTAATDQTTTRDPDGDDDGDDDGNNDDDDGDDSDD